MDDSAVFYTQKGYQLKNRPAVTGAMEDYLEMICREGRSEGFVRINTLAAKLNVRPSSASKMVYHLRALELVEFEKYGFVRPTEKGWQLGEYLLYRHEVLCRFFRLVDGQEESLEQVEQVEHFLREKTVRGLERIADLLEDMGYAPPQS